MHSVMGCLFFLCLPRVFFDDLRLHLASLDVQPVIFYLIVMLQIHSAIAAVFEIVSE